ncbi:MAG: M23 family metallopeptidase, partial [Limnohabitans sp.]|nr:M23 family metallopeptidase [Limnohabitans sp.]
PKAEAFLRSHAVARQALLGRAGRWVSVEADNHQHLVKLTAKWTQDESSQFQKLVITQEGGGFSITLNTAPFTASIRMASGTIQSSLFAATDDARIPDSVAVQLADVFSGDIDFHRALRKGDRFSVVYETLEADGEPVRSGRVLSAEFVNNGKSFQAMWFEDPNNARKGAYYNLEGQSIRRAYLASPLAFSRITSGFKMRFHPILQTWRAHLGIDYAAPTGTPVRSVGDGVVETAASLNGFGNVVIVSHRSGHSTVYAHLSKIQVKKGHRIAQGQTVGMVGATGWATGPHLHFEFRINGQHKDPQLIARQSEAEPVLAASKPEFMRLAQSVRQQLALTSTVQITSTQ